MKYEESDRVELKREMVKDLDKEIIAFLNTHGGTIYIGVDDDGNVVGVPRELKDEYDEKISSILTNNIKPNCRSKVEFDYNDDVLVMNICEGDSKPYYLTEKGPKPSGTYIRVGRSKRPANDDEILAMIRESSGWLWEKEVSKNQSLHFSYLSIYFKGQDIPFDESKYLTLGFVNKDGKFTNLALLFSDENPIEVKFAKYDKNVDFLFKKEFTGSLCYIADQVIKQSEAFNITSAKIVSYQAARIEYVSYPGKSLREAILNAICHADYSFPSNIKVEFFHTHCRISNPGPIYKYTLEEVLAGQQSFRNPGVVRILYMLGFIENYGSGLTRIINAYDKSALKAELLNMEHCFIVNLPNLNPIATTGSGFESQNEPQSEPQSEPQNEPQKAELQQSIIDLIKSNPKITRKEMSALLGKSMSTIFRVLKNNPNIKYIGSSKNGHWEIAEDKKDD